MGGVCCSGVRGNSILCNECDKWCRQERCSGLRFLDRVVDFQCPACVKRNRGEAVEVMTEVDAEIIEVTFSLLGRHLGQHG